MCQALCRGDRNIIAWHSMCQSGCSVRSSCSTHRQPAAAQALLAAGRLAVGGPLWTLALEQLLLRCVDTGTQV